MCQVYDHKCDAVGCSTKINMHLDGSKTDRSEIQVFCSQHIPEGVPGVLWTDHDGKHRTKVFVQPISLRALENVRGNHPNNVIWPQGVSST